MSAKDCCWDNVTVKSFLSTMKLELDLTLWIECYCNRVCRPKGTDDPSPIDHKRPFIGACHWCSATHALEALIGAHDIRGTPMPWMVGNTLARLWKSSRKDNGRVARE